MVDEVNETSFYMPQVVAIIDDESMIRKVIKRQLKGTDYRTQEYESGVQFYTALEENTTGVLDVILTDFNMPGMNADTMIEKIKESYPLFFKDVPIIGMTGMPDNRQRFNDSGVINILDKPFDTKKLTDILDSLPTANYL